MIKTNDFTPAKTAGRVPALRGAPVLVLACLIAITAQALYASGSREQAARPLVMALSGNPDTLDPQRTSGTLTFQTLKSVYDTLVEPDRDGNITGALAESWETSPAGLIWTFRLRSGVVFHNGDGFTSADVKATLERIKDPATASPKASEYAAISAIEAPDPLTVVIRLSKPYAPLLATLASGWSAIMPHRLIETGHDFSSNPVGTGPFRFVEWVRDDSIRLVKNERYWMEGVPKLDAVTLRIIPEASVQLQGLLTGAIDIAEGIVPEDIGVLERNPDTTYERSLSSIVMVLAMNVSRPGISNPEFRKAVNHAINRQQVLDIAYGGGEVTGTFMDSGDPFFTDFSGLYGYDPERARGIFASLGADTTGRTYDLVLPQNYPPHVKAGEIYQEMLSRAGLSVRIRLVDWSTWLSEIYTHGRYDFTVIGHTGKLDPDGRLAGYGTGSSYVRWENQEAAALIDRARKTADFEERKRLYTEVLGIMAREVPQVYTGTAYRYIGLRKNVSGFLLTPKLDTYDFRWCEKR